MPVIQVHRFRDKVAIYIGTGKTIYLTPSEAAQVSRELVSCASETTSKPFAESTYKTFNLQVNGEV